MTKLDDWPNRRRDLNIAEKIIKKYVGESKGPLVQWQFKNTEDEQHAKLTMPGWVKELAEQYKSLYGAPQFVHVLDNVLISVFAPLSKTNKIPPEHIRLFRNFVFFFFYEDKRSIKVH